MATQSTRATIDIQKVVSGAARLEIKALLAGVECWQVWLGQAAKLSSIANDTLQAMQKDQASLSATARRLTEFGRNNAEVIGDLSSRLSRSYYEELDRLATAVGARVERAAKTRKEAPASAAPARRASRKRAKKTVRT